LFPRKEKRKTRQNFHRRHFFSTKLLEKQVAFVKRREQHLSMSKSLTLVNPSGRIWDKGAPKPGQGLTLDVKYTNPSSKFNSRALYCRWNEVGDAIACIDNRGTTTVFHIERNRYSLVTKGAPGPCLAWTNNKPEEIMIAQNKRTIQVHQISGKLVATLRGHKTPILGFSMNYARGTALSYSADACIIWNLKNWDRIRSLFAPSGTHFIQAEFSPNGEKIITCFKDSTLFMWDLNTFEMNRKISAPAESEIFSFALTSDSTQLIASGSDGYLFAWDLTDGNCETKILEPPVGVTSVSNLRASRNRVAFLADDNSLYILELKTQRVLMRKTIPHKAIVTFDVDKFGRRLALIESDGNLSLYDTEQAITSQTTDSLKGMKVKVPKDMVYSTLNEVTPGDYSMHRSETSHDQSTISRSNTRTGIQSTRTYNSVTDPTKLRDSDLSFRKTAKRKESRIEDIAFRKEGDNDFNHHSTTNGNNVSLTNESLGALYKMAKLDPKTSQLNHGQLKKILSVYGEYPEKYRILVWRFLLQIPMNKEAFSNLLKKGTHPAFKDLHKKYPIESHKLFARLERILSCLAYWSPIFAEVDYFPEFVFPFIKMFGSDEMACFEVLSTIITHWCQHWFEFYPNTPVNILQSIDDLLKYHDYQLWRHFKSNDISFNYYAWPLLKNLFTEVLTREEWLRFFDTLITYNTEPELIMHFTVSYLIYFKPTLINAKTTLDIQNFTYKQNPINIEKVLKQAKELKRATGDDLITVPFNNNLPIPTGQYPIFDHYPKFIVDFQNKVRERIMAEEQEMNNRQKNLIDLRNRISQLEYQERQYRMQQDAILNAEKERKDQAAVEEELRMKDRLHLDEMTRERRVKQLEQVENTIQTSLKTQMEMREAEFQRMNEELERKKKVEEYELQRRKEEETLLNLEFKASERLNELMLLRSREEAARNLRLEIETKEKEQYLNEKLKHDQWVLEDEERRLHAELDRQNKVRELMTQAEIGDKRKVDLKMKVHELEKQLKFNEIEKERKIRHLAEDDILKKEEYMEQFKKKETLLRQEEEMLLDQMIKEEEGKAKLRAEERFSILEKERLRAAEELSKYKEDLQDLERMQQRKEFEDKLIELRQEQEIKSLDEERKLQEMLYKIEEERKVQQEMQKELEFKENELKEKAAFQRVLRETEEQIIKEEREKFENFRYELRQQMVSQNEDKEEEQEEKMQRVLAERQRELHDLNEKLRKQIREENISSLAVDQDVTEPRTRNIASELDAEREARRRMIEKEIDDKYQLSASNSPNIKVQENYNIATGGQRSEYTASPLSNSNFESSPDSRNYKTTEEEAQELLRKHQEQKAAFGRGSYDQFGGLSYNRHTYAGKDTSGMTSEFNESSDLNESDFTDPEHSRQRREGRFVGDSSRESSPDKSKGSNIRGTVEEEESLYSSAMSLSHSESSPFKSRRKST